MTRFSSSAAERSVSSADSGDLGIGRTGHRRPGCGCGSLDRSGDGLRASAGDDFAVQVDDGGIVEEGVGAAHGADGVDGILRRGHFLGEGRGVEHHVCHVGFELGVLEVVSGGLQGVEEKPGALALDFIVGDGADDLHERDLDGIGVLESGEIECALVGGLELVAGVEVAVTLAADGGRAALDSVDANVLAAGDVHGTPW